MFIFIWIWRLIFHPKSGDFFFLPHHEPWCKNMFLYNMLQEVIMMVLKKIIRYQGIPEAEGLNSMEKKLRKNVFSWKDSKVNTKYWEDLNNLCIFTNKDSIGGSNSLLLFNWKNKDWKLHQKCLQSWNGNIK